MGCAWLSMKRGGCKFRGSKTGAVLCPKRGAVVSQLVLKLKESVPPPPPPGVKNRPAGCGRDGVEVIKEDSLCSETYGRLVRLVNTMKKS